MDEQTINSNELAIIDKVKAIMRENLEFANTKEELEKFITHSQLVIVDFLKETTDEVVPTLVDAEVGETLPEELPEVTESDTLE